LPVAVPVRPLSPRTRWLQKKIKVQSNRKIDKIDIAAKFSKTHGFNNARIPLIRSNGRLGMFTSACISSAGSEELVVSAARNVCSRLSGLP